MNVGVGVNVGVNVGVGVGVNVGVGVGVNVGVGVGVNAGVGVGIDELLRNVKYSNENVRMSKSIIQRIRKNILFCN